VQKGILTRYSLFLLQNLIWLLVIIAVIGFSLLSDRFFTPFNLLNIIPRVSAIAILVIGQCFVMLTGHFDLSSESALSVAALVAGLLIASIGNGGWGLKVPVGLGIIVMLLVGALIGLTNGLVITKLRANNLVVTIAMLIFLRGLVYMMSPGRTVAFGSPAFDWLGNGVLAQVRFGKQLVDVQTPLVFVIVAFVVAYFITRYTQFGRNMYAIGAGREAAENAGIRSDRMIIAVYVISGLCSAIAGWILTGRVDSVTPRSGAGLIFVVQAAAIVGGVSLFGGRGSMIGALGGVLLWGVLETGLNIMMVNPYALEIVRGGLLLSAILLDALKVRYLRREAVREAIADTTIGLRDTRIAFE
jgi:ribose/xylose/arabinose/galactoside ABC-type transport system permease subunit